MSAGASVRIVAIDNAEALVILVPAVAGRTIALTRPTGKVALVAAAVLVAATAAVSLTGYWGLLFLPSVVLLGVAAARPQGREARGGGV